MKYTKTQKGFTLLELVFVIVILGIVASIGSSIIVQLYENYIMQRAMHRVSLKTELAANQIVNRLTYRIDSSVIVRSLPDNNITSLIDVDYGTSNTNPQVLEWIGYDNDSLSAKARRPGWSGYCDTNRTRNVVGGTNAVFTPGSDLSFTNTVIANLSKNTAGIATKSIQDAALLFSVGGQHTTFPGSQQAACYGYDDVNMTCIHQIASQTGGIQLNTDNVIATGVNISSLYKLAWTAYAIVPFNVRSNSLFDLRLHYNYQPWDGIQYYEQSSSSVLLRNVTSFKFSNQGGTIRFKLCATEPVGDTNSTVNVSVCKEKVVIR